MDGSYGSQAAVMDRDERVSTQTSPQELFSIVKGGLTYRFYDAADKKVRAYFSASQHEVMVAEWSGVWGVVIPGRPGVVVSSELYQVSRDNPEDAIPVIGQRKTAEDAITNKVVVKGWGKGSQAFRPDYKYRRAIMTVER